MNPDNEQKYSNTRVIIFIIFTLIILAGLLGWRLGQSSNSKNNQPSNTPAQTTTQDSAQGSGIKSLISYTLPNQLKELDCPEVASSVFIIRKNVNGADCSNSASLPIVISVDSANNKDCNQLQSVQNVSKHTCISMFINGQKTLKAETIYNQKSSYGKETAVNAYYIDTSKGVIKLEYIHNPNDNEYQINFDDLAKSVQAKK